MIYRLNDKREFDRATKCWICNEPFTKHDRKVREHCYYTGKCWGAAHNMCNSKYRRPTFTPVFFFFFFFFIISVNKMFTFIYKRFNDNAR